MNNYQKNFINTYKDIYHHRYLYSKNEAKDALVLIKKNLRESKISNKNIKNLKVLNVGTGRESFAFLSLGVKNCQLVDLSSKTKLNASIFKKKYKNFFFKISDFCRKSLKIQKFNYLYLNGVFHHFHSPEIAFRNILINSENNSKFFFRIYKSGSIKFYIVDYLRKFINISDQKKFNKIFKKKFNIKYLKKDLSHENPIIHFYEMCVDNFFVPDLYLFDIKSLIKKFDNCGLKKIFCSQTKTYDHSVNQKDNTGVSLIFEKINNKNKDIKLISIDQINDIKYKEKFIKETNKVLKDKLILIKKLDDDRRINLALDLLFICQSYRIFKHYKKVSNKQISFFSNKSKEFSSAKKIHSELRKRIHNEFSKII